MKTFKNFKQDAQLNEIREPDEALFSGLDEDDPSWMAEDGGGAGGGGGAGAGGGSGAAGGAGAASGAGGGECTCGTAGEPANNTCAIHGSYGLGYGAGYPYKKKKHVIEDELEEDGESLPSNVNSAGGGNVAGLGVGPAGEPGVSPEYQRKRNQLKLMNGPAVDPRLFQAKIFSRKKPQM